MKRFQLTIGVLLLICGARAGDDPRVKCLGIEQGLSNNAVTCVYQDARGFMWFGTYDGLNRYDGYGFTVYRTLIGDSGSLPFNNIATLAGDASGHLWVGGQKGIGILDPVTAKFRVPRYWRCGSGGAYIGGELPVRTSVHQLRAVTNGVVLAGTHSDGLIVFDGADRAGRQIALDGSGHYDVLCIGYDSVRAVTWLFVQKRGLFQLDLRRRRLVLINSEITSALTLRTDTKGQVWLGTDNGLFLLSADGRSYSGNYMPEKCRVMGLHVNSKNELCIGTDGAGVWRLCGEATVAKPLLASNGTPLVNSNAAYAIYEDAEGRKWIGTLRGGINVIEPRVSNFKTVVYEGDRKSIVNNFILSFCEDANHNVWIGTDGAGLRYWDRKKNSFTEYVNDPTKEGTINNNFITNILLDERERLWVATWYGGINRLDRSTGRFVHYPCFNSRANAEEKHVWLLFQDRQQRLWASATNDGCLYLYNRGLDRFELFDDQVQNLQSMTEDRQGVLWGGNYTSLIRIDREQRRHVVYPTGYPVRCLHEDAMGQFWVGTQEGGLLLFDRATGQHKRFTTAEGLPSNTILRILEDAHGNLWMSTYNGISEYQRAEGKFRNFSPSDGLQSTQFSFNAGLALSSGELLFGGIKGFNLFYPDSVLPMQRTPKVYLMGVRVQNQPIEADSRLVREQQGGAIRELRLPYDKALLSLDFTALEYNGTDKLNYAYSLGGWDKGWNISNGSRTANYSGIHEGVYTFRVKVSHADGTWSKESELLRLVVLPPWYRTWWAYLLYVVGAAGLVLGYVWYTRSRERLRYEVKLAQLETEKEKELVARKVAFFTHITHEFRGPLTLIINPVREMLGRGKGDEGLPFVYRNAQRLLGLVDQLLLFQKVESGLDGIAAGPVNIVELAQEVWLCFVEGARMKKISYRFAVAQGAEWCLWLDREKVEIALYNLLSNALKYTPEGGMVELALEDAGDGVEIRVKDSGMGIPEEVGNQVFDKFYQIKSGEMTSISGFGIGLFLVKQFVEGHGGKVSYTSEKGKGTCFRLLFLKGGGETKGVNAVGLSPLVREMVEEEPQLPAGTELISDKPRVLIVDDDIQQLAYMRHILEDSYTIFTARSGEEGLAMARQHGQAPDIIISDVHMDGISGIELCETVKNDVVLGQTPVILLTASASANNKLAGVKHGADDYITKPFDKDLLVARVGALLKSRDRAEQAFYRVVTEGGSELVRISEDDKEFLDRLIGVVEENIDEDDFSIKKLSVEMGMSHSHLYQKVKELSGQSLAGFIRYIRLKKAAELLISTPCNVNEAALQVGISDGKYFREQFHKQFGVNPSEYIKKYRRVFSGRYTVNKGEFEGK